MKTQDTSAPHPDDATASPDKPRSSATEDAGTKSQSLYNLIAQQPFFTGLNERSLQLLADSAMEKQFKRGQSILEEGSPANRFYLILEGRVLLESELKDRGLVPIETLGPGDDLGWSWLFPPYSLQLSARALEPTRTIFFYGTRLRGECELDHELGYQLTRRIAEVLIKRLRATQQRLIETVAPYQFSDR